MICPCGCGYEIKYEDGKAKVQTTRRKKSRQPVAKPAALA